MDPARRQLSCTVKEAPPTALWRALPVATASRLLRFDDIEKHLDAPPAPVTLRADLPNPKAGHTWKFIGFGPDDMLYMTVGAPGNVCLSPPNVSPD